MAVLSCPHCGSVAIIVGGDTDFDVCPKTGCGGIIERLIEPEAGAAIRRAFYGHDHGLESLTEQIGRVQEVNRGLERINAALNITAEKP